MSRSICLVVLSLVFSAPALAQLPAARTSAIVPPAASVGSSVDVVVFGDDLDGVTEMTFSHPGITAKPKNGKADKAESSKGKDDKGKDDKKSDKDAKPGNPTFTVTVAKDVPVGRYDCRVAGRFGISNPRAFLVHDRQTVVPAKVGHTPDTAAELPLNAYAAGQCAANEFDFWTFQAEKGQRLMIECLADEIDAKLSPNLAIDGPNGLELDRSRRTGFIDFTAPDTGVYTIRVSDMLYRGGPEFTYLLSASASPRLNHVFPPSGKAGTTQKFTVFGRNLPGGKPSHLLASDGKPLEQLEVEIDLPKTPAPGQRLAAAGLVSPSTVALEGYAFRLKSNYGSSNAVPILYSDGDVTLEQEATQPDQRNDDPAKAQKLSLPTEVAGRFYPRNDRDYYTFEARKGDVYYVEIVCDRLNLPAAPLVVVQRATTDKDGTEKIADVLTSPEDESNVGTPAFRTATRDFAMKWEVKDDGAYRMLVRDRFAVSRDDGALRYHLSIRKPTQGFQVAASPISAAPSETAVWNPLLRRGGSTPVRVTLFRQDGFDGDVKVSAAGLPPGVSSDDIVLSGGAENGILMLTAADDAKPWTGAIGVIAKAEIDGKEVTREARAGAIVSGSAPDGKTNRNNEVDPVVSRMVNQLAIAVCDEVEPVVIAAADDKPTEVVAGEKVKIDLKVKKNAEVKGALKLKPAGMDEFRSVKELNLDVSKVDKGSIEIDTKQAKLSPGTYVFYLASPAQVKYTRPGVEADPKDKKKSEAKDVTTTAISGPLVLKVLPPPEKDDKKKK